MSSKAERGSKSEDLEPRNSEHHHGHHADASILSRDASDFWACACFGDSPDDWGPECDDAEHVAWKAAQQAQRAGKVLDVARYAQRTLGYMRHDELDLLYLHLNRGTQARTPRGTRA